MKQRPNKAKNIMFHVENYTTLPHAAIDDFSKLNLSTALARFQNSSPSYTHALILLSAGELNRSEKLLHLRRRSEKRLHLRKSSEKLLHLKGVCHEIFDLQFFS